MPGGSSERFVGWFFVAGYAPESTVMDGSDSRHGIWSCFQIQGQLVKLKRRFSNEVNWRKITKGLMKSTRSLNELTR